MFDRQTKAGHLEFFLMFSNVFHCYLLSFSLSRSLTISLAHSFTLFQSIIESLLPCGTTFVFIPMLQSHTHTHSQDLTLTHSLTLSISHSITLDMLNKFCFNLYAQNSVFIGEHCNAFFLTPPPPSPVTLEFIELFPS
jgi:hypothetical protein